MRFRIIIENGVAWLVDEDNIRLVYFNNVGEVDDLRASCEFAVQDMEREDVDYTFETAPTVYDKHEIETD